jgi:predicted choloylglycine hydrolase
MADQLWGLLDGMNDAGLVASFTFGGRREQSRAFSVPIVIRYVLETCTTVDEGVNILRRVPLQCAYNVTLLDRTGDHATVWLRPGAKPRVTSLRASTNHQGTVNWREHADWTRTIERLDHLEGVLDDAPEAQRLIDAMLAPPMRSTRYDEGFGTLYTAVYRPRDGVAEYRWPGATWRHSFADFREEQFAVDLAARDVQT